MLSSSKEHVFQHVSTILLAINRGQGVCEWGFQTTRSPARYQVGPSLVWNGEMLETRERDVSVHDDYEEIEETCFESSTSGPVESEQQFPACGNLDGRNFEYLRTAWHLTSLVASKGSHLVSGTKFLWRASDNSEPTLPNQTDRRKRFKHW